MGIAAQRQQCVAAHARQKRNCRRLAPAVRRGRLIEPDALLCRTVEVIVIWQARFLPGAHEGIAQRVMVTGIADFQRAVDTVKRLGIFLIGFTAFEYREYVAPAPALAACRFPIVVILSLPSDIDHTVDRRTAAQQLALLHVDASSADARLGLGTEVPGQLFINFLKPAGYGDEEVPIGRSRFQQQHALAGLDEPACDDAPGRACADYDIVIAVHDRPLGARPGSKQRPAWGTCPIARRSPRYRPRHATLNTPALQSAVQPPGALRETFDARYCADASALPQNSAPAPRKRQ